MTLRRQCGGELEVRCGSACDRPPSSRHRNSQAAHPMTSPYNSEHPPPPKHLVTVIPPTLQHTCTFHSSTVAPALNRSRLHTARNVLRPLPTLRICTATTALPTAAARFPPSTRHLCLGHQGPGRQSSRHHRQILVRGRICARLPGAHTQGR